MAPNVRVRLGERAKSGPCDNCKGVVPKGELHAAVTKSFGRSKQGKPKYQGAHVHLFCLSAFLISDHVAWRSKARKTRGRRPGSSALNLSPEEHKERKHLIRTRARLLRCFLRSNVPADVQHYYKRILSIGTRLLECGGEPRRSMMRRDPEVNIRLKQKLGQAEVLLKQEKFVGTTG